MHWVIITFVLASVFATGGAQNVTIHVGSDGNGNAKLAFTPSSVNVTKGSTVTFVFDGAPGNHTVAQSSLVQPCVPLPGGFDSGFIFVPQNAVANHATASFSLFTLAAEDYTKPSFPTFNLTIQDDTEPIYFYCAQLNPSPHCIAAMVGAINAPAQNNMFSLYEEVAAAALSVDLPVPALSGVGAFATAPPGPLTGGFSGAAIPSAKSFDAIPTSTAQPTLIDSSSSRSTTSFHSGGGTVGSASGVSSASGTTIMTGSSEIASTHSTCPTSKTDMRGLLAFFSAALVFGLAVNIAGIIWLFKIRRQSRSGNTTRGAHKISPFV